MTSLNGSPLPLHIAPGGYTLEAPSLHGTVTELEPAATGMTRGEGGGYDERLLEAAGDAGVSEVKSFAIEVDTIAPGTESSTRGGAAPVTSEKGPAMVLRVPSIGEDTAQAVLYTNEAGVSNWVFPNSADAVSESTTRGGTGEIEFLLPLESEEPGVEEAGETRGRLTKIGRRLVRVFAWATEDIIGQGAMYVATRWEEKRRPYQLRPFGPNAAPSIAWNDLKPGRSLLLLHGTFSTADSAFEALSPETLNSLRGTYGERIFAFDHPTLHESPEQNVKRLFQMLPSDADLDIDIVTHSRGGLVGRELTERQADYSAAGPKVRVRRAVFVAAPLRGTALADTEHTITMLDRYTNLFTELPDTTFTISMEAIFMMVKLVYHGAAKSLPGLASMNAPSKYLQRLNAGPNHQTEYYAIAADFKPTSKSLLGRFGWTLADAAVDGIFGETNDGVVPTTGSYELQSSVVGFPIDAAHRLVFGGADGIHHCNYFGSASTNERLIHWLNG